LQYPNLWPIFVSTTTDTLTLKKHNKMNTYFFDKHEFNSSTGEHELITDSYEFEEFEEAQEFARASGYGNPYQKEIKKFLIAYQLGCGYLEFYTTKSESATEALRGLSVDFDGEITPGKPIYIGLSGDHRFNSDTLIYEYQEEDKFELKQNQFTKISELYSWLQKEPAKEFNTFSPFEGLSNILSITKTNNHND